MPHNVITEGSPQCLLMALQKASALDFTSPCMSTRWWDHLLCFYTYYRVAGERRAQRQGGPLGRAQGRVELAHSSAFFHSTHLCQEGTSTVGLQADSCPLGTEAVSWAWHLPP